VRIPAAGISDPEITIMRSMRQSTFAFVDSVVRDMLAEAEIPGGALAVVRGDELVYAQGYGVCDLSGREAITPSTYYPIASTTKAMNATLIASLVSAGVVAWDSPVQSYVPHFALTDPIASAAATLRDLICMRTGLPRHDWVWLDSPLSRSELLKMLSHMSPVVRRNIEDVWEKISGR
jgi:CubicO group peptidase (beta-lactamase class C family)